MDYWMTSALKILNPQWLLTITAAFGTALSPSKNTLHSSFFVLFQPEMLMFFSFLLALCRPAKHPHPAAVMLRHNAQGPAKLPSHHPRTARQSQPPSLLTDWRLRVPNLSQLLHPSALHNTVSPRITTT